jgi:hypothetical protein
MVRKHFSRLVLALVLGAGCVSVSHAAEQFIPQGYVYGPGHDQLPPLNSQQDRIDAMAAVRQTEIYKSQYRERRFLENLNRLVDHDFSTPNAFNSAW